MADINAFDETIRPDNWDQYVGQSRMKSRLEVAVEAAIAQRRTLDHILLMAPPGTGKTTLAKLIAKLYMADFTMLKMPIKLERFFDIVEEAEGVVFLDELHAAPKAFQEVLQQGLDEERVIHTPDGYPINVEGLVFIGATITEFRPKILTPLQQRFEIQPTWEPYTLSDIAGILAGMASRLSFDLDEDVCVGLAGACGATPRLAKRFVKAARDLHAVGRDVTVESVLDHVGVDADGLGQEHFDYLRTLHAQGGRMGLRNLGNLLCMKTAEVEDLERVLAGRGLVHLHGTGRKLLPAGKAKIGVGRRDRVSA